MEKSVIQLCAERAGYSCRSYTGRGMFSKECLGVDAASLPRFLSKLIKEVKPGPELDLLAEEIDDLTQDAMGRDIIIYFPNLKYIDEDAE